MTRESIDIAIIGGGPAGLAAGLYGARGRASTVIFERGLPGGQIVTTDHIENYPGFPDGLSGAELGELLSNQAQVHGAEVRMFAPIESLRRENDGRFVVVTEDGDETEATAVIIATGAVPRKLDVPGEAEFTGRGVSWCATCDGALFRDKVVAVVGGGDAAVEEALFLTKFASRVHIIHRRAELRATRCIQERAFANEKIELHWDRRVAEIVGEDGKVAHVRLASTKGDADEMLDLDGVFIFVGTDPLNGLAGGLCDLDENGYILTDENSRTSVPGLFAAGDVTRGELKQVITAAAKGATAAFEALRYVDEGRDCAI